MGQFISGTISGFLRSDGTTARTVTMTRVTNTKNGFTARELSANANDQQSFTYSSFEQRGPSGRLVRHTATEWVWNYTNPSAADPTALAGRIILNRTGLHVPNDCPANVRKDVRQQLSGMASSSAGTVSLQLVHDPLVNQLYAF